MRPLPDLLLVDDDVLFTAVVSDALRERGFSVEVATTGEQARRRAREGPLAGVVVDLVLPDDDGASLARELRELRPEAAILIATARPEGLSLLDRGVSVADDFFVKSNDVSELVWRIATRVDAARSLADSRQREHFLRGVVRLADVISPHHDLPTLTAALAAALLQLPEVEGARIEISAEAPGDPDLIILEVGMLAAGGSRAGASAPGVVEQVSLRAGASGRLTLALRSHQPFDAEIRDTLGALVGAAITAARQFGALKERQLRLERGYVSRHRKLSRVSNRLERLSEARDSFLALLSHDLRSPLAVVLGQIQLLEEGLVVPARIPKLAATVRRQSERMVQMVEDLLDRYRRDDAVRAMPDSGDAARIAVDMVENLRPLASARNQRLQVRAADPAPIEADIASIREVLANLLENAVRYSPEGSEVRVDVECVENRVQISIRDAGPGFGGRPMEGGSGLGLGLRAAARIVADAGGQLRTANLPAGGGLAVVSLPLALPRAAATAIEWYCSDEVFSAQVAGLLGQHWECVRFPNLSGALDRMRRNPPAAVVIDAELSDDVCAFVRRMKADTELVAVPVLAFAQQAAPLDDAGALAVLRRPIDGPRLVSHVRRALLLVSETGSGASKAPPDILTGLPSAGALNEWIDAELVKARADGRPFPVVVVRIDELKEINRQHGWLVGDQLLIWLADRLKERVRVEEMVARVDAETFAIAAIGRTLEEARALATDVRESVSRARPRLGVARVDIRVSSDALDLATLALGDRSLLGPIGSGRGQ